MTGITVHLIHPGFLTTRTPNSEPTIITAMPISMKSRCQLCHQVGCRETITTAQILTQAHTAFLHRAL